MPATVCEPAEPARSPAAAKQPTHVPVMERFPGNVVVAPLLPIVMPVAVEVPMEMVLEPSITTAESPEMFVPVKVRDANANETPPASTARPMIAAKKINRDFKCDDLSCMAPWWVG